MNIIKDSFGLNLRIMTLLRLYRPVNSLRVKVEAYTMYFISVILVPSLIFCYFLFGEKADSFQVNLNACFMIESLGFFPKLLPFLTRQESIRECINYFAGLNYKPASKMQNKFINDCVSSCRRNTLVLVVSTVPVALCWTFMPLLTEEVKLPLNIWLPFDTNVESVSFYAVYASLVLTTVYASLGGLIIDPLIGGLACHATAQIMCLQDTLQYLGESLDDEFISYKTIKDCIQHHNAILTFVEKYEDCFSLVAFSQFASSTFVICFACLELSKTHNVLNLATLISVAASVVPMVQIYYYCYYGTLLFEENNNLTNAVYMSKWYELDEKSKKALITIMERSQKPMIVSAGKILDLSLATFATIVKRSYSLIAVLKRYQ